PIAKIRERHRRLWGIVAEAVGMVDTSTFWDNSSRDGPSVLALFSDGFPIGNPKWPEWASTDLTSRWPPVD
ncbi:MAG TPA: hypothetical protein VL068_05175, partial [Microthrixaceae bacterium]|nr:hypothetical protein [Microthrixaceae bacterium]